MTTADENAGTSRPPENMKAPLETMAPYPRNAKALLETKIRQLRQRASSLEVIRDALPTQMNMLQEHAFRMVFEEMAID